LENQSKLRADLAARESSPVGAPSASRQECLSENEALNVSPNTPSKTLRERYAFLQPVSTRNNTEIDSAVHRYSGSRNAWIRIMRSGGRIRAEVRDEGRGLQVDSKALTKTAPLGVGISGMRERVEQLGGTFELESAPGRGTTLRATLPLAPRAKEAGLDSDESESQDAGQQGRKAKRAGA
jgi:histidine kinase/DNA gyrase B/HSP90-like ATPase